MTTAASQMPEVRQEILETSINYVIPIITVSAMTATALQACMGNLNWDSPTHGAPQLGENFGFSFQFRACFCNLRPWQHIKLHILVKAASSLCCAAVWIIKHQAKWQFSIKTTQACVFSCVMHFMRIF